MLRTGGQTVVAVELSDPVEPPASLGAVAGRTVVAAGGDGTLRVLAQHLWHQGVLADTVLGLLPLGTGNDLARTVGIPLDPADTAAVVLSGRCRPLDFLFDDTDTLAVNAVHCGVGGLAVRHAAPLKPFLGRLAYRVGAAWAGARAKGWQVHVELDDRVLFEGNALFVGIGNGTTIGGGAVLCLTPSERRARRRARGGRRQHDVTTGGGDGSVFMRHGRTGWSNHWTWEVDPCPG